MLIDIVIVNWNTGELLAQCLRELCADSFVQEHAHIVVVDNDSQDESWRVASQFGELVSVEKMTQNLGFGRACNYGAKMGSAPYILFLNPDTKLPAGAVMRSIDFLQSRSDIGVLGIRLFGHDQSVQRSCARFPSLRSLVGSMIGMDHWWPGFHGLTMQDWAHDENAAVDHVIGAYYLLSRDLFNKLNGFDERYFVYLEDIDFSKRVHDTGLGVYYLADIDGYHLGGGSSKQIKAKRLYYSIESRFLYALKHLGIARGVVVILATFSIEMPVRILRALARFRLQEVKHVLLASVWLLKSVPSVLRGQHNARLKGLIPRD